LLELEALPGRLPKIGKLEKWPGLVGENFVFSLRLPRSSFGLDASETSTRTDYVNRVSQALSARFVVVQTPASATPTTRTKDQMTRLLSELGASGATLAWEPHGVWEDEETVRWAEQLGVLLVRDLSRGEPPPGRTVYTRLLALGEGRNTRAGAAQRVSDRVRGLDEAYVVLEGTGTRRAAQLLRQDLSE
jgi:uncharacterized protein YecE (DUF72 family)